MSLFSGLKERLRDGLKRSQEYLASGLATVLEPVGIHQITSRLCGR